MEPRGTDYSTFKLDAAAAETLTDQLADNLRRAIANGIYKPGDTLPGVRQMAKLCGTSIHVSTGAMKALTEEGLVKARPRIGCVVLGKNRKNWHGRVLLVHVGVHCNYNQNVFLAETSILLEAANWRVEHTFIPRRGTEGGYELASFRKVIVERYDLCVLPSYDKPVIDLVRESGVPYLLLAAQMGTKAEGCVGVTVRTAAKAMADFLVRCRETGVRRVIHVRSADGCNIDLCGLCDHGIAVEPLTVPPVQSSAAESFARDAYAALLGRFQNTRLQRPDLIVFDDDYIAHGGFWALEHAGLRVPGDMKVVSLSNRNHAPFHPFALARFEFNPFEEAVRASRAILRYLRTGRRPGMVLSQIRFLRGDTF